jgi:homoserine acetyltransferase
MNCNNWIGIRGLVRGDGYWGDFRSVLKKTRPEISFESLEIPGNGTRFREATPLDVKSVIEKFQTESALLKSGSPVGLVGMSLGGMVALKWAELYPNEISHVVTVNTSLKQFSSFYQRLLLKNYPAIIRALANPDPKEKEKIILKLVSNKPERQKLFLKEFSDFSSKFPVTKINFLRQLILASRISINKKPRAEVKVLCSRHDQLVEHLCSRRIAEHFNYPLNIHPSSGHDIFIDDPEWIVKQISNFTDT